MLNPSQIEASTHFTGPMMVLAGPGSGKTTVITHRVINLIEKYGVDPKEILVIAFTKAATEEMKKRFQSLCTTNSSVVFSTFHSLFFKIIRECTGYTIDNILKDDERKNLLKSILCSDGTSVDEDFLQSVSNEITMIKNELISIKHYNSMNLGTARFIEVYSEYREFKKQNRKLDFDDMLVGCYHLLKTDQRILDTYRNRYKFILIDEFQDINNAQYQCVKLLSHPLCNLFVVGDDDQSIYKFRGARPEFLFRFPTDYPNTRQVLLNVNYRSDGSIISVCNKIISFNKMRYPKEIVGTGSSGIQPALMVMADIGSEAMSIAQKIKGMEKKGRDLKEIAVIYRTNVQARAFVDAFMNMNIPYQLKDEMPSIYEHWISRDICAYLELSRDRNNDNLLRSIINKPNRYISKTIILAAKKSGMRLFNYLLSGAGMQIWRLRRIEELAFHLRELEKKDAYSAVKYIRRSIGYDEYVKNYADYRKMKPIGLFEVLDELQEASKGYSSTELYLEHVQKALIESKDKKHGEKNDAGVILSTMHSAKGLEFETVFIAGVVEGLIPHEKSKTAAEIEEERRLLYVGMTRAKHELYISVVEKRYEKEAGLSRFLSVNGERII